MRHCVCGVLSWCSRWGFRRIEDICWIKTNKEVKPKDGKPGRAYLSAQHQDPRSTLVHTKVRGGGAHTWLGGGCTALHSS